MTGTSKERHCKRFTLLLSYATCDIEVTREDGEKEADKT
jgi:hypothetical protein